MIDPGSGQGHADEAISIRQPRPSDREWILGFLRDRWGSDRQVADGQVFYPADHLGFIALVGDEPTGLLTYRIEDGSCEVTLLDSGRKQTGIGSALLRAVEVSARERGLPPDLAGHDQRQSRRPALLSAARLCALKTSPGRRGSFSRA
jgi:GNAT superfamily N-acetyltransferase